MTAVLIRYKSNLHSQYLLHGYGYIRFALYSLGAPNKFSQIIISFILLLSMSSLFMFKNCFISLNQNDCDTIPAEYFFSLILPTRFLNKCCKMTYSFS